MAALRQHQPKPNLSPRHYEVLENFGDPVYTLNNASPQDRARVYLTAARYSGYLPSGFSFSPAQVVFDLCAHGLIERKPRSTTLYRLTEAGRKALEERNVQPAR